MMLWVNYFSFICLAFSILSLWFRKSLYVWGVLFLGSYVCALASHVAEVSTLIPTAALCALIYFWNKQKERFRRLVLFLLTAVLSFLFMIHLLKGFHNWNVSGKLMIGNTTAPFTLWVNYDKPLVGLFLLALAVPLLSGSGWRRIWKKTVLFSVLGILVLIAIAYIGGIRFDPKVPPFFGLWTLNNLIFVAVSEEAFYRGFIQKEFYRWLGKSKKSAVIAVMLSSLVFALVHFGWVANPIFLIFVFIAGLIYGGIYQYTNAIESSIFCHFLLNVTHFYLFTYPA